MNIYDTGMMFDKSYPRPPIGAAVEQEWFYFNSLVQDQLDRVPFRMVQSGNNMYDYVNNVDIVNEVMMWGWNVAAGGGSYLTALPAIGYSLESYFTIGGDRVMETHMYYYSINKNHQARIFSGTINTAQDTIDFYLTVNRLYFKLPFSDPQGGSTDRVWGGFQPSQNGGELAIRFDDTRSMRFIYDHKFGYNFNMEGVTDEPGVSRKAIFSGIYEWEFPGFRCTPGRELRIADGYMFLPTLNETTDLGNVSYRFKAIHAATIGIAGVPVNAVHTHDLTYSRRSQLFALPWNKTTDATPTVLLAKPLPDRGAGIMEITLVGLDYEGTGAIIGKKFVTFRKTIGGITEMGVPYDAMPDKSDIPGAWWRIIKIDHKVCVEVTGINQDMFWNVDVKFVTMQGF